VAQFDLATLIALLVVFVILSQAIKIVREYERVVIFRLGRFSGVKGPGIFFIIPIIDRVILLDLRVFTIDVAKQVVITRDNVSVEVDAVIYYRVVDPSRAVIQVENYKLATSLLAQTTLRDVLGQIELDDLLSKRDELNKKLQEILDRHTDPWGIKVTAVTLRDVALPESMRRAIAKQAESEREKRSRIILADGEFQASKTMTDAARLYEEVPAALKLRELQTLVDIAREKTLIVVTPSGDLATGSTAGITAASTGSSQKGRPPGLMRHEERRPKAVVDREQLHAPAASNLFCGLISLILAHTSSAASSPVLAVQINDAITPASDDIVSAAVQEAEAGDYQALILFLDTPGGGLTETTSIIKQIEETRLPVIGYVYPEGATAWSAGTLILQGSDLAAMAPHTIIGSAQPVQLSPLGGTEPINDSKTTNAIVALIEEKARMHGRKYDRSKGVRGLKSEPERR